MRETRKEGGRAGAESPAFASAPGRRPGPCPVRPCLARPAPVWQRLMAAVGPPQQQVRMAHQQVWAALEVALRVPCLYIIDAIFNSYHDPSQSRFCIGLQIFLRLLGEGNGVGCVRGLLSESISAGGGGRLCAGGWGGGVGACVCQLVSFTHHPESGGGRRLCGPGGRRR